ncbi:MAG TPA: hypothetical protein VIJ18_11715 [Microbacteriaceae bacterium]
MQRSHFMLGVAALGAVLAHGGCSTAVGNGGSGGGSTGSNSSAAPAPDAASMDCKTVVGEYLAIGFSAAVPDIAAMKDGIEKVIAGSFGAVKAKAEAVRAAIQNQSNESLASDGTFLDIYNGVAEPLTAACPAEVAELSDPKNWAPDGSQD